MKRRLLSLCALLLAGGCAPESSEAPSPVPAIPGQELFVLLSGLGLPTVASFDVAERTQETYFEVPEDAYAYELSAHPTEGAAMAYSPPPDRGETAYDRSGIYGLREGEAGPRIGCSDEAQVFCHFPSWTPDGTAVWAVGTGNGFDTDGGLHELVRVDATTGEMTSRLPWATEPAVSPTGDVAWIQVDPGTRARKLVIGAEAPRVLVAEDDVPDLGLPFFSADGAWVYFVVVETVTASLWDRLIPSAYAHGSHSLPGDWWRVSIDGGTPERVTYLDTIHHDGLASPDGAWLFIATREGLVQVDLETGEDELVLTSRLTRAVAWRTP